ncbi:hypothetical protein [Catenulispora pinisilvae]|nr:hypothetical protein [Catenulispora pinisilvae]
MQAHETGDPYFGPIRLTRTEDRAETRVTADDTTAVLQRAGKADTH